MKITEQQLIKILSDYYEINEINTKSFQKLGYFKTSLNTYKSFIKKAESVFESVERLPKTTNDVYYIVGNKRKEINPIEDKRVHNGGNNNQLDNQLAQLLYDNITEKTYSNLVDKCQSTTLSVSQWIDLLKLPKLSDKDYGKVKFFMGNYLHGRQLTMTTSLYKRRIYDRSVRAFKSALNILQKENKLKFKIVYYKVDRNNKEIQIQQDEYSMLVEQLKLFLEKRDLKLRDYYYNSQDRKVKQAIKLLIEHTGISKLLIKYNISITEASKKEYNPILFEQSYYERLDELTDKLINRQKEIKPFPFLMYHKQIMTLLNEHTKVYDNKNTLELLDTYNDMVNDLWSIKQNANFYSTMSNNSDLDFEDMSKVYKEEYREQYYLEDDFPEVNYGDIIDEEYVHNEIEATFDLFLG